MKYTISGSTSIDLVNTKEVYIFVLERTDYYYLHDTKFLTHCFLCIFIDRHSVYILFLYRKSILKKCTISSCEHALKQHGKWKK